MSVLPTPHPIPDPQGHSDSHEICSRCGCFWRGENVNLKDEWCSEPRPGGSCYCHSEAYWDGYLAEIDRRDAERKAAGEQVLAYVTPRRRW